MSRHAAARNSALHHISHVAGIALLALTCIGFARADSLATNSYNFQLLGDSAGNLGGGGASATLNGTTNLEIFCVDYNNNIFVPYSGYTANVTALTQTGFGAGSNTRFGAVTEWQNFYITKELGTSTEATTIESATAFQRYEMAAYLISLYNVPAQSTPYNNGIQTAIWQILNPATGSTGPYPDAPDTADPTWALNAAADWLHGSTQPQLDAYLANYRIVSDATMTYPSPNLAGVGGFQEMITYVPEPSLFGMFALAALGLMWQAGTLRKRRAPAALIEK